MAIGFSALIKLRTVSVSFIFLAAALFALASPSAAHASGVVEANDDSYYNEVVRSEYPVILEFYADWCGACKKAAPVVSGLAGELSGRVKVVRMNVDRSRNTASRYNVSSIPAFFYVEDGNVRGEAVGAMPRERLLDSLGVPESGGEEY